jgi:hypothetical protein
LNWEIQSVNFLWCCSVFIQLKVFWIWVIVEKQRTVNTNKTKQYNTIHCSVSNNIITEVLEGGLVNCWYLQLLCVSQTIYMANLQVITVCSTECNQISVTVRTYRIFCSLMLRIIRQNWWSQNHLTVLIAAIFSWKITNCVFFSKSVYNKLPYKIPYITHNCH